MKTLTDLSVEDLAKEVEQLQAQLDIDLMALEMIVNRWEKELVALLNI